MKLSEIQPILNETAEENQIINLVVKNAVAKIKKIVETKPGWFNALFGTSMFSDFDKLTMFGMPLKDLDLPKINSEIYNILKDINIVVKPDANSENTMANYSRSHRDIYLYFENIVKEAEKVKKDVIHVFQSTLAHELQHAIDDVKSKGHAFKVKNVDVKVGDDAAYRAYLKLPYEVNARFSQALHDIQIDLDKGRNIRTAIDRAFKFNEITEKDVNNYKRLLSRAYKFFDAHTSSPKQIIRDKSFIAKAKAWILGKEEKVIK